MKRPDQLAGRTKAVPTAIIIQTTYRPDRNSRINKIIRITFDKEARVDLALGGLNEVEEWIAHNKRNPIVPNGDSPFYGKAFEKLVSEIQVGIRQVSGDAAK